ncbi:MAG: hypothetical protein ACOC88_02255 [Candidatus Bipolaricaulota bacterium]
MDYRVVRLVYPARSELLQGGNNYVRLLAASVEVVNGEDIYATVERFKTEHFPSVVPDGLPQTETEREFPLEDLTNLHNCSGIASIDRIRGMAKKVGAGEEIFMEGGLPNAKLAKTNRDEIVLFDGHHSVLAYMTAGRTFLSEIPHILVLSGDETGVSDPEVHAFYGELGRNLSGGDWRGYVINWQGGDGGRLEARQQRNMGELLESVTEDERW